MKNNINLRLLAMLLAAVGFLLQSCGKDNKEAFPPSKVTGTITYNGQPVRQWTSNLSLNSGAGNNNPLMTFYIRQTAPQPLSLADLSVFAKGDGTFTYSTFDGDYTLLAVPFKTPWKNIDPISFTLKGTQNLDVKVTPYIWLSNLQTSFVDSVFTATFRLDRVLDSYVNASGATIPVTISEVRAYFNVTNHVDAGANILSKAITNGGSNVIGLNTNCTLRVDLKGSALTTTEKTAMLQLKATTGKLWANIGVRTTGITDHLYQEPVRLQ